MDVQGSQTLAPTRSAWPILCLRIVRDVAWHPLLSVSSRCSGGVDIIGVDC